MTVRRRAILAFLIYLTFCSIFFGWVFANPFRDVSPWIGLLSLFVAQIAAIYLLVLVTRTEERPENLKELTDDELGLTR